MESVLGQPEFHLKIPATDPTGEAYLPAWLGNSINVQAIDKAERHGSALLATRKDLREVAQLTELLLKSHGQKWVGQVCEMFGLGKPTGPDPDQIELDVPRLGRDDPAAQLAFALAALSRSAGIPLRREATFVGTLDNRGDLAPAQDVRKRALTAYEAGSRLMVVPSQNKNDLLFNTFSIVPPLRGPVLERLTEEKNGQWRLYIPKSYSKTVSAGTSLESSFDIYTGTLHEIKEAEMEAYRSERRNAVPLRPR